MQYKQIIITIIIILQFNFVTFQVASKCLGIETTNIHISETSTDKVPNTSATAGSASSDLNGMAIIVSKATFFSYLNQEQLFKIILTELFLII